MSILAPNFVNVSVNLPPVGIQPQSFNTGLIIGTSTVITATERVRIYTSLTAMVTDGFSLSSTEYLAAQLYFSQVPQPSRLCVGRRDATASETSLVALQACRNTSGLWYMAYDSSAIDTDHPANAAWAETQTAPFTQYILNSSAAAVKSNTGGNLFATLKAALYRRSHGVFSTTAHIAASVMGYAMGQTSNLANSTYTLKFKKLPGVTAETITETQVANIEGNNGNVYVNRGNSMYEQGTNFNGQFFDEVIGLDILANSMSINVQNLLTSIPAATQTEAGMALLTHSCKQACDDAVRRGFLAPGVWTGPQILGLNTGDTLAQGYTILNDPISSQSDTDRAARKATNIYACVKEAGAIHSSQIAINVNR